MLYSGIINKLNQLNKQDYQLLFRNNNDAYFIYNIFVELDKPLYSFKPLIGAENLRMVSSP